MFSAHKLIIAGVLSAVTLAGCQRIDKVSVNPINPAPIIEDEAMALRNWPVQESNYAAGYAIADPTLYPYGPRWDLSNAATFVTAPALFYGQSLLLPVTAIVTPPWKDTYYRGVYTPPTFTAVPVAPDDARHFTGMYRYEIADVPPARRARQK